MQKILVTICFICCSLFSFSVFAQRTVKGVVSDEFDQPLVGVTISLKGQNTLATTSDLNGEYSLRIPADNKDNVLQVSLIGYISQTKNITKSDEINFYLKEKSVDLDMVVVTGTRTPKLLKNSPIITKVITESDIKKIDATNIGALLQSELPGIEFSYSMNQQVSLNMQGFGGNSVLFLVDGERIAGETLDNIDYNRLNLDNVVRIEIIKGAASTLYGSSALGGVVNIITKDPSKTWSANLNSRIGTYNDERYGGSASFSLGKFGSSTSIQHVSHDGYTMIDDEPHLNSSGKLVIDTTKLYAHRLWNFKEKINYQVNNKIKLTGRAGYYFRERDSQATTKDRYRGFSGGLSGNYIINEKDNLELAYSFDQFDKSTYNSVTSYDVKNYSNVQNTLRGLYNHTFDKRKILTIGGDFMRDYLMSYQFKDNSSYDQYVSDIFTQFDWTPIDNFNILTGLRYDYFSEDNINRVTPKIGLMYRVGNCSLRGSYAGGFRAPTLKEMYMSFNMANVFTIHGNPDLKSETSDNFTLSTEYTNSYYNLSVTGYYNRVNNRITTAWDDALEGQIYTNIKKIDITGVDVNASAKFPCGIGTRVSYAYTHEKIKKGEPLLPTTRPHTATARLEYGKSWKNYGFNIMLNGRFLSRLTTDIFPDYKDYTKTERVSYSPYSIWKLSLLQTIYKGVDLTLAVDNLFNYTPSIYNFNSPYTKGTTFSIGVSLDIEKLIK